MVAERIEKTASLATQLEAFAAQLAIELGRRRDGPRGARAAELRQFRRPEVGGRLGDGVARA